MPGARRSLYLLALASPFVVVAASCGEDAFIPDEVDAGPDASAEALAPNEDGGVDATVRDAGIDSPADAPSGDGNACTGSILFMTRGTFETWKVSPDGGDAMRVSPEGVGMFEARWIDRCNRYLASTTVSGVGTFVATFSPDGGDKRTIIGGNDPSWDEAHGRIVFSGAQARRGLFSVLPDGGDLVTVVSADVTGGFVQPSVSPDGTLIAAPKAGQLLLIESRPDGGTAKVLPNCRDPEWHPSGAKIACDRSYSAVDNRIVVVDVATGVDTEITSGAFSDFGPTWSPDGTQIAFARGSGVGNTGAEVHVMNADGSNIRKITTHEGQGPNWR